MLFSPQNWMGFHQAFRLTTAIKRLFDAMLSIVQSLNLKIRTYIYSGRNISPRSTVVCIGVNNFTCRLLELLRFMILNHFRVNNEIHRVHEHNVGLRYNTDILD